MSGGGADHKAEIVIIRRNHGDHDDGHHGGAWKIAYADFVTAMMAFFLVMWLINASNEATRAQVASYFNPVKLTDSSTAKRGLEDPKETLKQKQDHADASAVADVKSEVAAEVRAAEDQMMQHPQEVLDKIAGAAGQTKPQPEAETQSPPDTAPRDPFDPQSWQASLPPPESAAAGDKPEAQPAIESKPVPSPAAHPADSKTDPTPAEPQIAKPPESQDLNKEAEAIKAEILSRYGAGEKALPANLEVKATHEGVLISLTDRHQFSMFAVGSAEPRPKLIALAGVIAGVLKDREGGVIVRGHTDARPYRNKKFDNWQLSTARAHMAYYMLLRGGLPDDRVLRVEGYADRDPVNPADPNADENRRIDILLNSTGP